MEFEMRAIMMSCLVMYVYLTGCVSEDALPPHDSGLEVQLPVAKPVGDPIQNSIGMLLVPIPAGEFMMGSPQSDPGRMDQEILHRVILTQSFHLGQTEVTQGQWKTVMDTTPWEEESNVRQGDDYPAVLVNWNDAVEFCRKLSEKEGVQYRLPTEAEWEYACRAGTTTVYSFGDDPSPLGEYSWYSENVRETGENHVHIVGQKKPNPWGLYDIHGNVWEWCQDWVGPYPYEAVTDPRTLSSGQLRVNRGGSWNHSPWYCRSAFRGGSTVFTCNSYLGFRVVRNALN